MTIQTLAIQLLPEYTGPISIESVSGNFILTLTQKQDSIVEKDSRKCDRTDASDKCECQVDFHGAAILDENGNEVPITEEMIRDACRCLQESWHFPRASEATPTENSPAPDSASGQNDEP